MFATLRAGARPRGNQQASDTTIACLTRTLFSVLGRRSANCIGVSYFLLLIRCASGQLVPALPGGTRWPGFIEFQA